MAATYSIAVVGDWDSVMGFRALGLETHPVRTPDQAREEIKRLAKTDCAVIYLTETLAKALPDVLDRYKDELRPAIILIPGAKALWASDGTTFNAPSNVRSARTSFKKEGINLWLVKL